jgi:hypothetical protein
MPAAARAARAEKRRHRPPLARELAERVAPPQRQRAVVQLDGPVGDRALGLAQQRVELLDIQ